MSESYVQLTKELSGGIAELGAVVPNVMKGFSSLAQAASGAGALDKKTKELIALSIGVAGHCKGCIGFHTKTLVDLGTTREEISEALGVAVYMGGGPSLMYASEVIQAFNEFSNSKR